MNLIYVDGYEYGFDLVIIKKENKVIYQGKSGTISLSSDIKNFEIEILNQSYELEKKNKNKLKRVLHLISMIIFGLFHGKAIGKPYYFKIRASQNTLLQYNNVRHYFTSNTKITQEKIKDQYYILFWFFNYIIPLQIVTIILGVLLELTFKNSIIKLLIWMIIILSQFHIFYRIYDELRK